MVHRTPTITVTDGRVATSIPPAGSSWPDFPDGLPDGVYVPRDEPARRTLAAALREADQLADGEAVDAYGDLSAAVHAFLEVAPEAPRPNVQTVTVTDPDVMQLAADAVARDDHEEARRILTDRLEWYAEVGAAARAGRRARA